VAALEAAADVDGEELFNRFSLVLSSNGSTDNTRGRKTWRATRNTSRTGSTSSTRGRRSRQASQDPQYQDFDGIGRLPALEKLHDLGVWIHRSSQRDKAWLEAVGIQIGIDNMTRWSSWYQFIDKALRKQSEIKVFMIDHEDDLDGIKLTTEDWDILSKAHSFLQPFAGATLYAESDKSSIG
jgi:hypothetical protein